MWQLRSQMLLVNANKKRDAISKHPRYVCKNHESMMHFWRVKHELGRITHSITAIYNLIR